MPWPPDGAISADDRLIMLEFYSGIPAGVIIPTTPTVNNVLVMRARFHVLRMKPR